MILLLLVSCRREEPVLGPAQTQLEPVRSSLCSGFYLLNEGNMGSNKCTLDWFDFESGIYSRNIYPSRNPGVVKELGDVGNDIAVYGGKLYVTVNCSHLLEVMDAMTAVHKAALSIPNCRSLAFDGGYAYVSSYAGPVELDPNARRGYVAKVDTLTMQVVATCTVGYQPEEMAVVGRRMYVANSGGYMAPNYDCTVSVIDLDSFTVVDEIEVAPNLNHLKAAPDGRLWLTSRGDYKAVGECLYVIEDTRVVARLEVPCSQLCLSAGKAYVMGGFSFLKYDCKTLTFESDCFIDMGMASGMEVPYGLAVNPENGDIYVSDAGDYVTPGMLYSFRSDGSLRWKVMTGDIPAHFAFLSLSRP